MATIKDLLSTMIGKINNKVDIDDLMQVETDDTGLSTTKVKAEYIPTISIQNGGTGCTTIEDVVYADTRYRASSLHAEETAPTVNGTITWKYE
jgi:hypothetical protein